MPFAISLGARSSKIVVDDPNTHYAIRHSPFVHMQLSPPCGFFTSHSDRRGRKGGMVIGGGTTLNNPASIITVCFMAFFLSYFTTQRWIHWQLL